MNLKLKLICFIIISKVLAAENLGTIYIIDNDRKSSTGSQIISEKDIKKSIKGNGFLSSLLQDNPNIKVKDTSKNSSTAGEITPGKISINGASFYQNNISIDGISNNSVLDPVISDKFNFYDVPGNENESFIDLDLIERIDVYDSGISAEYGNFLGGVIDIKTKRVKEDLSYKFTYKMTSNKFTKFHVLDEKEFKQALSDDSQPIFKKTFYNIYIGTPINQSSGLLLQYSKKKSVISGSHFRKFENKYRLNQNLLLKYSYYFEDDSIFDTVFTYSPYESTHFKEDIKDSDVKLEGGGNSLKFNYEKSLRNWEIVNKFAIKESKNKKTSKNYYKEWIVSKTKPWGQYATNSDKIYSSEGGSGNIEKEQKSIAYNIKLNSNTFDLFGIKHKIKTGLDLNHDKASYLRSEDTRYYTNSIFENHIDCNGDIDSCIQNEQYFETRRIYKKEDIDVTMNSIDFYVENKMKYKDIEFTPGLRLDYNNYLKNLDIAYRLNTAINISKNSMLYGGLNRYYGKSFLGYKLREARLPYYEEDRGTKYNILENWSISGNQDKTEYQFFNLKTPYSDESVIGIKQDIFGSRIDLKYVNRNNKNIISSFQGDYKVFLRPDGIEKAYYKPRYFTNNGKSTTEITSIKIISIKPIHFYFGNINYALSTSWIKNKSNVSNYDDILSDEKEEKLDLIYYKDKFIHRNSLDYFEIPRNYNLNIGIDFNKVSLLGLPCQISLNNVLNYQLAYTDILATKGNKTKVYTDTLPDGSKRQYNILIYEDVDYKNSLTYDLSLSMDFKLFQKHHLVTNFEINNVFDKVQNIENDENNYKLGRQFWFNLEYKF